MRLFVSVVAYVLCGFLWTAPAQAQIEYVTVSSQGSGPTLSDAIYDGIRMAIEQVNGAQVAAQTSLATSQVSTSSESGDSYAASEAFAQAVTSQTKGTVREYRIVSSGVDPALGNLTTVDLEVVVAKFKRSAQLNRKRLAVMPFRIDPSISARNGDIIGEAFGQSLITFLTQTRKFALLDRDYLAEQQAELGIVTSGQTPIEELAKLGQMVSADMVLVGTITKAATRKNTISSSITGVSRTTYIGNIGVSYRVIDAATGQIKWADTYASSTESGAAGGVLTKLSQRAAGEIGEKVLNAIYPVTVAAASGNELVLGQGGRTIEVGQRFKLIMLGQTIQDKHTGESLGAEEIIVGEIEIVSVTPKQSRARVVKADSDPFALIATNEFIVRPMDKVKARAQAKAKQAKQVEKEIDAGFESFEKENSEQW